MTSDRYRDLGGGVFDDGHPDMPPMLSNGRPPTCPRCGEVDKPDVTTVAGQDGRYLCACGTLFNGGEIEWRKWGRARKKFRKIAAGDHEILKPQKHEKRKPIAQRLEESNIVELHPKKENE